MEKLSIHQLSSIKGGTKHSHSFTERSNYTFWILKKLLKH